jgi:hypothetical protein
LERPQHRLSLFHYQVSTQLVRSHLFEAHLSFQRVSLILHPASPEIVYCVSHVKNDFLPVVNLNPAMYPALDRQPPTNSPQVLEWINQINFAGIPKIPVNGLNGCQNASVNAAAMAAAGPTGNCELLHVCYILTP